MTIVRSRTLARAVSTGAVVATALLVGFAASPVAALQGAPAAPPTAPPTTPGKPAQPTRPDAQGGMQEELAAAMAKAAKYIRPGPNHRFLERFLGTWETGTRIFMGPEPTPAEKGTVTGSWLMEGRWLKLEGTGSMMGMTVRTFTLLGYDNFKQSFVSSAVSSADTAMNEAEGDLDPSGEVLLMYGTLDEYLTGEHDKMVKYVYRFHGPDRFTLEIHDLPIGERNTKVVEIEFTRVAG